MIKAWASGRTPLLGYRGTLEGVKIGLPDTLLYSRYGAWWESFFEALGIELVKPVRSYSESLEAGALLMPDESPLLQLFIGRVMEIAGDSDALLLPDLNPGSEPGVRGSSGDPWMVDLPNVLSMRFSIPPIHTVPALVSPKLTPPFAVRLGQALTSNAQLVRRVLDRHASALRPARYAEPTWQQASMKTVGIAGNPALLEQDFLIAPLLQALHDAKLHPVLGTAFPRERTLETGRRRRGELLLETDLEFAGGAGLLEQKAQIKGIIVLTEPRNTAQSNFAQTIAKKAHKPALMLELDSDYAATLGSWSLE